VLVQRKRRLRTARLGRRRGVSRSRAGNLDGAACAATLATDDVQAVAVLAVVERHAVIARFGPRWAAHELVAVLVCGACLVAARRRRVTVAASALFVGTLDLRRGGTEIDERTVFEPDPLGGATARRELSRAVLLERVERDVLRGVQAHDQDRSATIDQMLD